MKKLTEVFTGPLLHWFDLFGRKDLPWQNPRTPYRVWISEIMLQQTQVKTVIPYFERFMTRFPTLTLLAQATEDQVLSHWSGLGYYSRGRNIHKTAQILCQTHQAVFPKEIHQLIKLPGIGPSTAAAIASLAFNQPTPILDGNVKRVLARYFMLKGAPTDKKTEKRFFEAASSCMSQTRCTDYTQAIMDLGALCCRPRNPNCKVCPLKNTCLAHQASCVTAYPERTIKPPLPVKEEDFFIRYRVNAHHTLQIYLEKRPSQGIWGGLWCLPTRTLSNENAALFYSFKHTFTHFHLNIRAYTLVCDSDETDNWFTYAELNDLGIPKPITTLLTRFLASIPTPVTVDKPRLSQPLPNTHQAPSSQQQEAATTY